MRCPPLIPVLVGVIASLFHFESAAIDQKIKKHEVRVIPATPNKSADDLLTGADSLFQSKNYAEALQLYQQAYDSARSEFNPTIEVEALSQMARMKLAMNLKEEGRDWLALAASRVSQSDPMGWSRFLSVKGRYHWKDNELASARSIFEEQFEFCTSNALWGRAVDAANMLSIVCEATDEQIAWSRKGITAASNHGAEQWLGPLWNNLAGIFFEQGQLDSALACYETSREFHWRHSDEVAKLFADYHIGMTLRKLGRHSEAARWLRPVLAWAERIDHHGVIGQALEELGEIAIAEGSIATGKQLLQRALGEYAAAGYAQSRPELVDGIKKRINSL